MILSSKDLNRFRIHRDEETIHQRDIVISHSAFVTINRLVGMTCSLASIIIIIRYLFKKKKRKKKTEAPFMTFYSNLNNLGKKIFLYIYAIYSQL